jgi:hypothetical protein
MTRIFVLFNLKVGTDKGIYENWARNSDAPSVNDLPSVNNFTVHRATGVLGSEAPSPFDYIEILDVSSMDGLFADISTDAMQAISSQFEEFADEPHFIVTEALA